MNDWVRHAEAKLGIVLASAGVSAGLLFSLVRSRGDVSVVFAIAAVVCGVSAAAAGLCAMAGLYPVVRVRRRESDKPMNPLFFHDVARTYADASSYSAGLHGLTIDPGDLVRHLGQQVHANALVADRKYRWSYRAVRALLLALLALGAVAVILAVER